MVNFYRFKRIRSYSVFIKLPTAADRNISKNNNNLSVTVNLVQTV